MPADRFRVGPVYDLGIGDRLVLFEGGVRLRDNNGNITNGQCSVWFDWAAGLMASIESDDRPLPILDDVSLEMEDVSITHGPIFLSLKVVVFSRRRLHIHRKGPYRSRRRGRGIGSGQVTEGASTPWPEPYASTPRGDAEAHP